MRPSYSELTSGASRVNGSAWGLWGDDDEIGALNDVTPAHVAAAAALVQRGAVFSLNWDLELPSPGLFSRGPQCSSQWDALSHFSHPEHGYYGGRGPAELKRPLCKNGIHNLARRGIASRFVLADVARCREADRRPIDHAAGGVSVRPGRPQPAQPPDRPARHPHWGDVGPERPGRGLRE